MSHNVRHILHAQLESWLLRVKGGGTWSRPLHKVKVC